MFFSDVEAEREGYKTRLVAQVPHVLCRPTRSVHSEIFNSFVKTASRQMKTSSIFEGMIFFLLSMLFVGYLLFKNVLFIVKKQKFSSFANKLSILHSFHRVLVAHKRIRKGSGKMPSHRRFAPRRLRGKTPFLKEKTNLDFWLTCNCTGFLITFF